MPRGPEISRHHVNVYGDLAVPGCMGGMLNMFDWNNAVLSGNGKKPLNGMDFPDGLEAPRNSLDFASGGSGSGDSPKSSSATKADIPFGFKITKPVIPAKEPSRALQQSRALEQSRTNEKRLRGPNVVARLMGLDALPYAPSSAAAISVQQSAVQAKNEKERVPVAQTLLKVVVKGRPQSNDLKARVTSEPKATAGKDVPKNVIHPADVNQRIANQNDASDFAPARDVHPQEKQLQEFKKQFASKLAIQSRENRERRQSESVSREAQVKRVMTRERMDEAKAVFSRGEKNDPERLEAALKKLNKSKEFQEVLEVLQSNKDFFAEFLQDPTSLLLDKHLQETTVPEESIYRPPPPIEVRKVVGESESKEKFSEKKIKGGISPSAFARRFMESRREVREQKQKQKSKSLHGSKSQSETEENTPISTPRTSTSLLPKFRSRSKNKSVELERSNSTTISKDGQSFSTVDSYKVDPYSPGKIGLLRPGSDESTGVNSPVSVLSYSPHLSRSGKDSTSKNHRITEEATEYHQYEAEEMSTPRSDKSRLGDSNYASPHEDITRHGTEGSRFRGNQDEYEREISKDPKDIARIIIREARASAREFAKFEHSTTGEGRPSSSSGNNSSRRISKDIIDRSDGEIASSPTGRLSTSSSRNSHHRASSGMASISSAVAALFSPRASSQELSTSSTQKISIGQRQRKDGEKQQALRKSAPDHTTPRKSATDHATLRMSSPDHSILRKSTPDHITLRKSAPEHTSNSNRPSSPRSRSPTSSSQASSKVLRKALAGSLLENRILGSKDPQQCSGLSLPQVLEKGETSRMMSTTGQSGEDSVASTPRTLANSLSLQRCRSVPNAALVRDTRSRGELPMSSSSTDSDGASIGSSTTQLSHEPSVPESVVVSGGKQFADSYKRGVEAVGSLFAKAKSKERNKIFVRSRKKLSQAAAAAAGSNEPKSLPSSYLSSTSQESMTLSCSSSHLKCSVVSKSEDSACAESSASNASALERAGLLAANISEAESGDVKRVSFASDVPPSLEGEQPDLLPCVEPQLPGMPPVLAPCMQRVRVNADITADRRNGTTDSITTTTTLMLDVSAGDQLPRTPKTRSLATDTPRSKDEETHETVVDKSGQPSPISVLDSPFEEDSPSPLEFNEISSDLQELRLRLHLLKLDGNDRPRPSLDRTKESSDIEAPVVNRQLIAREPANSKESTDFQSSCSVRSSKTSTPTVVDVAKKRAVLDSIDLEGFPCPEDKKEDLVYVRNLLVASEFVESVTKVFTRWHSPSQPLDSVLFQNLEECYNRGCSTPQFLAVDGLIKRNGIANERPRHRILFDAVNEVLLRKLGPYLTFRPWVQPSKPLLRPAPIGRALVWDTWMDLCDFFPSCEVDASSFLLDRDLGSGAERAGVRDNFEEFGLELEKTIFDDLIHEAVQSLLQVKYK